MATSEGHQPEENPPVPEGAFPKLHYVKDLRLGDLAAAQAVGADAHALIAMRRFGVHRAQIDVPAPLGDIMRVTDVVSRARPFAANFTNLCHEVLQKIPDVRAKHLLYLLPWTSGKPKPRNRRP